MTAEQRPANGPAETLLQEISKRMQFFLDRAEHCLAQISEEQTWYRAHPRDNTVGNLILHVVGNLSQWVLSGIGGHAYNRDRPAEFSAAGGPDKAELTRMLRDVVGRCRSVIDTLQPDSLGTPKRIQGMDVNAAYALISSLTHFGVHVGQMLFIAKTLVADAYRESWTPKTKEQGA
jgi:hypothetical protein